MRGKPLVAIGIAVALAVSAGACAGRTDTLGTVAGACFRAVPPAESAIHNKGKLAGVRRISSADLGARLKHDVTLSTLPQESLCVIAFKGTYARGSVTGAHNATTGQYAIVAVGAEHPVVVAAFVVNQLPTRFRHTH